MSCNHLSVLLPDPVQLVRTSAFIPYFRIACQHEAASAADAFACSKETIWEVPDFSDRRGLRKDRSCATAELVSRIAAHAPSVGEHSTAIDRLVLRVGGYGRVHSEIPNRDSCLLCRASRRWRIRRGQRFGEVSLTQPPVMGITVAATRGSSALTLPYTATLIPRRQDRSRSDHRAFVASH